MSTPKSVAAGQELADQLIQQLNTPPQVTEPETPTEPQEQPAAPEVQEQPQVQEAQGTQEVVTQPDPDTVPLAEYKAMEQRYKSLQGLHRHQKFTNEQALKAVGELKAELDALKEAHEQGQPTVLDTAKLREEFGADMVSMVEDVATKVFRVEMSRMEGRLAALEGMVKGTTQVVAQNEDQMFFVRLTQLIPDWRTTNDDEAFHQWLSEVDPVYGAMRQDALEAAHKALDADRVAAIFRAYQSTLAPAAAPARNPLEKQVTPSRAAPTQTVAAQAKPQAQIISSAEVTQFYTDVARGVYRGREKEQMDRENAINQAIAEGRIR